MLPNAYIYKFQNKVAFDKIRIWQMELPVRIQSNGQ